MDVFPNELKQMVWNWCGSSFGAMAGVCRQWRNDSFAPKLITPIYQRLIGDVVGVEVEEMRQRLIRLQGVPRLFQLRPRLKHICIHGEWVKLLGPYAVVQIAWNRLKIFDSRSDKWHTVGPWKMKSPAKGFELHRIKEVTLTSDKRLRLSAIFGNGPLLSLHASGEVDFGRWKRMQWVVLTGGAPDLECRVKHTAMGLIYKEDNRLVAGQIPLPMRALTSWEVCGSKVAATSCHNRIRIWDLNPPKLLASIGPDVLPDGCEQLRVQAVGPGNQAVFSAYTPGAEAPYVTLLWNGICDEIFYFNEENDRMQRANVRFAEGLIAFIGKEEKVIYNLEDPPCTSVAGHPFLFLAPKEGLRLSEAQYRGSTTFSAHIEWRHLVGPFQGKKMQVEGASFHQGRLLTALRDRSGKVCLTIADFNGKKR